MRQSFDVVVIGGGAPGESCALALAEGGARVALVERELLGGTSSYWGCVPSKTLLRPGEALAAARAVPGAAEALNGSMADANAALRWRDFMVANYSDDRQASWARDVGVELVRGEGRLAGSGVVVVAGTTYLAQNIVIATGSDAAIPPIPGLRELAGIWTNREATAITDVPCRLIVLGAGPIGVELGQALARLGCAIVLVEKGAHVLPREPRPLGEVVGDALVADGVDLRLDHEVTIVRLDGDEYVVEFSDGSWARGDRLLVATGRRPRVDNLGLETVGIEALAEGIQIDDRMSCGAGLWAIGDVTGLWNLTHVGEYQGRVAAANILGQPRTANYEAVPRVVFSDPPAALVGEATGEFVATVPLCGLTRTQTYTRAYETLTGFVTLVSDGERLVGAYGVGPHVEEWLQQMTLAIRSRTPISVLLDVIQPFPTFSEVLFHALRDLERQLIEPHPGSRR